MYVWYVIWEYNIYKSLVYRYIVCLWDIFEIDYNMFCMVFEYCSGMGFCVINFINYVIYCGVLDCVRFWGCFCMLRRYVDVFC